MSSAVADRDIVAIDEHWTRIRPSRALEATFLRISVSRDWDPFWEGSGLCVVSNHCKSWTYVDSLRLGYW